MPIVRAFFIGFLAIATLQAAEVPLNMHKAWARVGIQGGTSAVYGDLKITTGAPVAILEARSDVCARVELHETVEEDGVSKMIEMDAGKPWQVRQDQSLTLAPGGKHIMLIGLKTPLHEGEKVSVSLKTSLGEIILDVPVQKKVKTCGECCGH